jgi:hypothetical protein
MSNRFWTIFVLTWVLGPCLLWITVLCMANGYFRFQRSLKLLIEQIHGPDHPGHVRRAGE